MRLGWSLALLVLAACAADRIDDEHMTKPVVPHVLAGLAAVSDGPGGHAAAGRQ